MLLGLIDRAVGGNQELRILNEDVQIASDEVLARRGTYLPFVTIGGGPSLTKASSTPEALIYNIAGDLVGPLINMSYLKR
jgi:outer membrane protein TolC